MRIPRRSHELMRVTVILSAVCAALALVVWALPDSLEDIKAKVLMVMVWTLYALVTAAGLIMERWLRLARRRMEEWRRELNDGAR